MTGLYINSIKVEHVAIWTTEARDNDEKKVCCIHLTVISAKNVSINIYPVKYYNFENKLVNIEYKTNFYSSIIHTDIDKLLISLNLKQQRSSTIKQSLHFIGEDEYSVVWENHYNLSDFKASVIYKLLSPNALFPSNILSIEEQYMAYATARLDINEAGNIPNKKDFEELSQNNCKILFSTILTLRKVYKMNFID
ncbi:unnamed protein product [Didymodactylos carnosus]|uniref:Uncharacterized protein n=1 Tax=Didymodactylos carnosus TaxID=1234261 RepID=A0A8S2DMC3_9BILA|nr:unnamed protein product [Didymodactylos carnosus]CAF3707973.1 unnamed protein product [Didymodactylos carnosus]